MPAGQAEEIIALALVFVVHVVGGLLLVWALLDGEQRAGWRRRWGRGGGDDRPAPRPPSGPARDRRPPLPLPTTSRSRVRLREPIRAGEVYPRPARRPAHPKQPAPLPAPRDGVPTADDRAVATDDRRGLGATAAGRSRAHTLFAGGASEC